MGGLRRLGFSHFPATARVIGSHCGFRRFRKGIPDGTGGGGGREGGLPALRSTPFRLLPAAPMSPDRDGTRLGRAKGSP